MALTSPGVEVTIIDQSQYLPAPTNSVPFVLLATAEDKPNPNGIGVAPGTTAANAGKLFRITSQRDLVSLYGTPTFYTTSGGDPLQGYELNEYGLLAAYSALGAGNSIYCVRADVDLASLVGSTGRPTGEPTNGTYWLDTSQSTWGIYEFNATTGTFALKSPIVISDSSNIVGGYPVGSLGNIGDYAVNALPLSGNPTSEYQYFVKNSANEWVGLGTAEWLASVPAVVGTQSGNLTAGDTFLIGLSGGANLSVEVPAGPNNTPSGVATAINNLGLGYLSASVNSQGRLQIFSKQSNLLPFSNRYITISTGTGTVLTDLGITAGQYNQPQLTYGTSAQQPSWQAGQQFPRPSGSVWIKLGSQGNGYVPTVSVYNSAANVWSNKIVTYAISDAAANAALNSTGGQGIPAGTVYAQYGYNGVYYPAPIYLFERIATGPTVVTGDNTSPSFTNGPYTFSVSVSQPGTASLTSLYIVSLADNTDAADFVAAWQAANIPYTTAEVTSTGAIQLTHTLGGVIVINDAYQTGVTNGLLAEAGFVIDVTEKVKQFNSASHTYTTSQSSTSGTGIGLNISVITWFGMYNNITVTGGGSGHAIGDQITFNGSNLGGVSPTNDLVVEVTSIDGSGGVTGLYFVSGTATIDYIAELSNWVPLDYEANEGAPVAIPANLTNWYYSVTNQVDIMVNFQGGWKGYKNQGYDSSGFPSPTIPNSGATATDPNGPIIGPDEPTEQSDNTPLVYGDLWLDTSDLENYPVLSRWQSVDGVDQWVAIDNTDQTNPSGILFADARWATNGTTNPANDPIPTIKSLLSSDYLDLDAPEHSLYPNGMLLFNTRRSGYNVKQFRVNYFNGVSFPDASLPAQKDAWVSISGLQSDGAPYMGRKAQRAVVVQSLRAAIDNNQALRDEDNFFNLMACPNYPELQPNMVLLNGSRGDTCYILGDTPMRLVDQATAITAWATNAAGAASTGEQGCVTRSQYMGLFYPSGLATDLTGNLVVVPPSHMMLRTFLRNDTIAYPWLAAAGTRRGLIDNAVNIGYINPQTGEFQPIKTPLGIRDVLYQNFINPLVFFTGNGLLNYGNKSSFTQSGVEGSSALDRTNVARLVAYIRRQLTVAARPFVFEPNDSVTRAEISGVVESLMLDLLAKRGIYDYLVVCDETNNTPERIDRNELWIDVALEPTKAAEFIYIPVRILNTGELTGATAAQIAARPA